MSDEYTKSNYLGLDPQYGPILPYIGPGTTFENWNNVPIGVLLKDVDGNYCVRIQGNRCISIDSPVMYLLAPEGETPYTAVPTE